ncbi:MAG: sugar transferase [Silicimonas sp.]|nr:sugar transferase [Silicimonas sp.]NNF92187.1 sugar transferase [Boseongicola sp.]RZW11446.1 MAG: sugar transferase [Paracoccaceae bacterium]MBT8423372.1 sugar transferase [Silicimonas sp.]NND21051.1 sugar transferase [Silicimonas sp.]
MTVHATSIRRSSDIGPITSTQTAPRKGLYRSFAKRLIDIVAVLISLPIMVPFMGVLSALIALDGHSPVFRQDRIGKDGRRFVMWKFRTMVPNAEELLDTHLNTDELARDEWNAKQKLSIDPRVTRIGRLLRRTSLDELPQLFNVLKGDMSLIGPRPMMPCQQALYPGQSYYRLRPGMTGSWQVSARHNSDFAERAHYDDLYDSELSLLTDLRILAATTAVVLRGTGV